MYHLSGLIYIYSNAHQTRENCFGYAKAWKKWYIFDRTNENLFDFFFQLRWSDVSCHFFLFIRNIDYAYYQTVSFIQEHFETMEREFTESPELASSILMVRLEDGHYTEILKFFFSQFVDFD